MKILLMCLAVLGLLSSCSKNKQKKEVENNTLTRDEDTTEAEFLLQIYIKNTCTITNDKISNFVLNNSYLGINEEEVRSNIGPIPKIEISNSDEKFIGVYRSKFPRIKLNTFQFKFIENESEKDILSESNELKLVREDFISELGDKFVESNSFRIIFKLECPNGDSQALLLSREKLELALSN